MRVSKNLKLSEDIMMVETFNQLCIVWDVLKLSLIKAFIVRIFDREGSDLTLFIQQLEENK